MNPDNHIEIRDDGFTVALKSGAKDILWKDIQEINAYKDDLMTYDVICLDIILTDSVVKITEEVEGWSDFTEKLNKVFPAIDKEWYINIMLPAFETNFITLFKK
jgi:hypothetical protein